MSRKKSFWHLLLIAVLCAATVLSVACSGNEEDPTPTPSSSTGNGTSGNSGNGISTDGNVVANPSNMILDVPTNQNFGESTGSRGLSFSLSEGQQVFGEVATLPVADGESLPDDTTQAIIDRLPTLQQEEGDTLEFNLPPSPLPRPLTGDTIDTEFPADGGGDAPEVVPDGPLEVLRFSPEGEIPIAPFVSVTFNQPMIALATLEQLDAADVPVTITPELPGKWSWIGTKTLRFDYESAEIDRFPKSTTYNMTILAGTESATGGVLAETVSWTFTTPTPQVTSFYPQAEGRPTDTIMFIEFDQRVNAEEILPLIQVSDGRNSYDLRLATAEEIEADSYVSGRSSRLLDDRSIAVKATEEFNKGSQITVEIGPNIPSAEGDLTSDQNFIFTFWTYNPFELVNHYCGWRDNDCLPYQQFNIEFNNPIDTDLFDLSMISIEPELPGAIVGVNYSQIVIRGATQGRTTYEVTLSGAITDIFGQTLDEEETVEFRVGSAESVLTGPSQITVIPDPSASNPSLSVFSINYDELEVKAYAVTPDDWPTYRNYLENYWDERNRIDPPGELVYDEEVETNGEDDVLTEVTIDLSEALDGDVGHLFVLVEPKTGLFSRGEPPVVQTWVQVTNIGVDAYSDNDDLVVWATALLDGAALAGAEVNPNGGTSSDATDSDGLLRLPLSGTPITHLVVTNGDDSAILPRADSYWGDYGWERWTIDDEVRWFVFDDRAMYRPGEEFHLKGWVRQANTSTDGSISLVNSGTTSVRYTVYGPQGNEIASGDAELTALGGFDLSFTIPDNANLGFSWIDMQLNGTRLNGGYGHEFQIQEFRRPEFEVSARTESVGPYFVGDNATVSVLAEYFSGGPLPDAEVEWWVNANQTSYSPPNWSEFTFGSWSPPWFDFYYFEEEEAFFGDPFGGGASEQFQYFGRTDANGIHFLRIDFDALDTPTPTPYSVRAESRVTDVNRQTWSSSTSLLVHPSDLYVGIRSDRYFVKKGEPLDIEVIVTDVDGAAQAGKSVTVLAERKEWRFTGGRWQEVVADIQTCETTSAQDVVVCTFETENGGSYDITATVVDESGRANISSMTRWVSGGNRPKTRNIEQESVTIIPSQESLTPGDVGELLVQSPFGAANGIMTILYNGIADVVPFEMTEDTIVLEVPISEQYIPNLTIQVDLVGSTVRTADDGTELPDLPERPAYASGQVNLSVSTDTKRLTIDVAPQETGLEPGGSTVIDLSVTDDDENPVAGAEVTVVVVDEAVLALTNYQLGDPVAAFYFQNFFNFESRYGRRQIILSNPQQLAESVEQAFFAREVETTSLEMDDMAMAESAMVEEESMEEMAFDSADESARVVGGNTANTPIVVRSNFNPLALFTAVAVTGGDGTTQVDLDLPDNLTRYRVIAVAGDEASRFGSAETNITARLPIQVRPSAPRFLNFGDVFELPIVIQNQTDELLTVDVAVQATNIELTAGNGQRVTIPANNRVEVRFPATTEAVGTGRLQIAAVAVNSAGDEYVDAAAVELPIYTPATTEAFATYGVIDEGATVQPLAEIEGIFPQFGGLEIGTSSTALQALTDAVLYLVEYRFESTESLASRILAISALRDVLDAFSAETLPSTKELDTRIQADVDRLESLQNPNGGFPYWRLGKESIPFNTIHVTHALILADQQGYEVNAGQLATAKEYLANIEQYFDRYYSESTKRQLRAHALYVLHVGGTSDGRSASQLFDEAGLDGLSLEASAWLWQIFNTDSAYADEAAEIDRHIENRAVETANAANFVTSYDEQAYLLLQSDRRTDANILNALITIKPDSDLIVKVVNGLLGGQTRGRWGSTQENVFVLLALNNYFNTFEAQTPDFVARIWLGDTYAAEHVYEGRTTERYATDVPMQVVIDTTTDTQDIVIAKDGDGRLYYRLGLSYAPEDLFIDARDQGFVVQRTYEAVDDPEDIWQDEDGVWHVKAGARIRVRVTMVAENRRYHVALVDPLAAGLEIVNPALAVSADIPSDPNDSSRGYWWSWTWYDHQNNRDERAEAFATTLWQGEYTYSYVAQATTPGTFVVPPAKAEEMYSPEVFGRSASDMLIVEP